MTSDVDRFLEAAEAGVVFNAPLGEQRAADLIARLEPTTPTARALDLGCGAGELLVRLCQAHGIGGDGVDRLPGAVERARARAAEAGQHLTFHCMDAAAWTTPAELVVSVGASHIWGTAAQALDALRRLTLPGGRLVFGDGIYRADPAPEVTRTFGDLPTLAELARSATAAGLRPLHVAESGLAEWDDFESAWRQGIEALGTDAARAFADERREEYLAGYRGVVGFAWLVLAPG